jgi:acyl transferase domain-containing protein
MNNLKSPIHLNGAEIAIIGMAGRFPGAGNIDEFWTNLRNGIESISFFKQQELEFSVFNSAEARDPNYVKAGGVIENVELFDAAFFGFNPREAEIMDPQQRIFLECAWEALENAGYDSENYQGLIGVYAGAGVNTYLFNNIYSNINLVRTLGSYQIIIGNNKDHIPLMTSYKLNLKGPSINIQTDCSTALVTVHLACQSLLNEECDLALAGAVTIRVPQQEGYLYQEGAILSPDGHCRAFDVEARGTVFSSGAGVVVLKRLADALDDGDCIQALLRSSAVNNDGALKAGFTAPGVNGQAGVIAEALAVAGIPPETIGYIETHGTGTDMGDPIEITALKKVFGSSAGRQRIPIGSVKTNIGHCDTAAGIAGLIKTVMMLKHRELPPSLHFKHPNPKIDIENSPFYVNNRLKAWESGDIPRRAGVSSFGFGGTNAHLILEEAPEVRENKESRPWQLLLLSAKTGSALEQTTANLLEHFKQYPATWLPDVAFTLQVGRRAFNYRRMLVCRDIDDAVGALEPQTSGRVFTHYEEHRERPVVFMFPGQGTQYARMGLELYHGEPVFRDMVDRCAAFLKTKSDLDIRDWLYPSDAGLEKAQEGLQPTLIAQTSLFVTEYAIAQLWIKWGISPVAMIGQGIGEYVAACLAGVFTAEEVLELMAISGRLTQSMESLTTYISQIELHAPNIPYISNVTGAWITAEAATDPDYWVKLTRRTDRFREGIVELLKDSNRVLLEVGPGEALGAIIRQYQPGDSGLNLLASMPGPDSGGSDQAFLLNTLGKLWLTGIRINWPEFYSAEERRRIPLPAYPFERKRYWIKPAKLFSEVDHKSQEEVQFASKEPSGPEVLLQENSGLTDKYVAPRTEVEKIIAEVWQEFLGIPRVGITDHFFELDGNSLLATQIISRIRQIFQVELPLRELFDTPTIESVAAKINEALGDSQTATEIALTFRELQQLSEAEVKALSTKE